MTDFKVIENRGRDSSHQFTMLRLIRFSGFATPRAKNENGNPKRLTKRSQWINGISKAGILEHHHRLFSRKPCARRDRNRFSLVAGHDEIWSRRCAGSRSPISGCRRRACALPVKGPKIPFPGAHS